MKFGKLPRLILDLACGTGRLTTLLAERGYDMIGIDISPDTLEIASRRGAERRQNILFLQQDMTEFELYGTVDTILCCFDSVNYITDSRKLKRMFKLCENYLNPGGLLIFDINSPRKFEKILANNTFVYEFEDIFCVWENNYNKRKNEFHLTFFEESDGKFEKFEETHMQRCYEIDEIEKFFVGLKMSKKACYNAFSHTYPRGNSERIFFVYEKTLK